MKYPYDFKWKYTNDVLEITLIRGISSKSFFVYGITPDFKVTDAKVKGYLDMLLTDALEVGKQYELPECVKENEIEDTVEIHESLKFLETFLPIVQKKDLKPLLIQMWGAKKNED